MVKHTGQAGARARHRARGCPDLSFADVPPEMVNAAVWALDEFVGEVSQATLVQQLMQAILNAAPCSVRRALHEYAMNSRSGQ